MTEQEESKVIFSAEGIGKGREAALQGRLVFAEQFGQSFKRRPPIVVRREPEWKAQLIYADPSRPRWTCALATLGNALRVLGVFQPESDSEPIMVQECEGLFQQNGFLDNVALAKLINNRSERGLKWEPYAGFEQALEGLKHGKVALHDVGRHLVLLSKLAIQNEEVGVLVVDPLNSRPVPNFVSLKDLARGNSVYSLLSLERVTPSRQIRIKTSR